LKPHEEITQKGWQPLSWMIGGHNWGFSLIAAMTHPSRIEAPHRQEEKLRGETVQFGEYSGL
jgi:hypothetical protein